MKARTRIWGIEVFYVKEILRLPFDLRVNAFNIAQSLGISPGTPGKWLFVDYPGDKVPICDISTGEILYEAEILFTTLAYSGYTYFEARRSQDSLSFSSGLNRAFGYIGGTPKVIISGNLKAGVITNSKSDLKLNRTLLELGSNITHSS